MASRVKKNAAISRTVEQLVERGFIEVWRNDGDVDYYLPTANGMRSWMNHVMHLSRPLQKKYGMD